MIHCYQPTSIFTLGILFRWVEEKSFAAMIEVRGSKTRAEVFISDAAGVKCETRIAFALLSHSYP